MRLASIAVAAVVVRLSWKLSCRCQLYNRCLGLRRDECRHACFVFVFAVFVEDALALRRREWGPDFVKGQLCSES